MMRGGEGARRGLRGERIVDEGVAGCGVCAWVKKFFKSAFLFDLFL